MKRHSIPTTTYIDHRLSTIDHQPIPLPITGHRMSHRCAAKRAMPSQRCSDGDVLQLEFWPSFMRNTRLDSVPLCLLPQAVEVEVTKLRQGVEINALSFGLHLMHIRVMDLPLEHPDSSSNHYSNHTDQYPLMTMSSTSRDNTLASIMLNYANKSPQQTQ